MHVSIATSPAEVARVGDGTDAGLTDALATWFGLPARRSPPGSGVRGGPRRPQARAPPAAARIASATAAGSSASTR